MHDYLLSSEWVRFAFVLGVAVSMVMYEKRHLTTGSIVVPGYIAVFIIHPLVIVATFLNAFATYLIVNRLLRRYFLLYGRTKFTLLAIISTSIQTLLLRLTPSGPWLWEGDIPLFIGVGYVVPALIAHDMARQGVGKTTKSVLMSGVIVAIPIAIALVLDLPGVNELAPVDGFGRVAIPVSWLPLAIVLSIVASWAVAHNYGLRSGGFVGAAFVGMFMADPWQVVIAVAIALVTYVIVARFLMKHMILFGRRKFSSMLLVSASISWSGLWIGDRFLDATWEQHLGVGSLALTPLLLPGLLANDAQRTSPKRVFQGLVVAGLHVVSTTLWIRSMFDPAPLRPAYVAMSAATALLLFFPQLASFAARVRSVAARDRLAAGGVDRSTPMPAALSAVASWTSVPWAAWAIEHPEAASNAESWLDRQLSRSRDALVAPLPGTAATDAFDRMSSDVLAQALDAGRGITTTPRRPDADRTPTAPAHAPLATSSTH